ncbi:MAG: RagB/SusD family nutrient uptake outer membrane protein [Ferruginibacter sp.]
MKKIFFAYIFLLAVSLGCTKILNQEPQGSFNSETLKNRKGAEALVVACYSILDNKNPQPAWGGIVGSNFLNNASLWQSGDLRSDDAYKGGGGPDDGAQYNSIEQGIVDPSNEAFPIIWKSYFFAVSRCNKALQILLQLGDDGYPERTRRVAEVKVLRGWYYMQLKKLFRKFPYIDENIEVGKEGEITNDLSEQDLWQKIIADFQAGTSIEYDGQDIGRINKYVAYSLLTKSYMFTKDYAAAINAADQVLLSGKYHLQDNLEELYSDPHAEHDGENIFALEANLGGGAEANVRYNWADSWTIPTNGPYGGGDGFQRPSQNLVNAFKTDAVTGLPLLDNFNDADLEAGSTTTPVDPRLDIAIGRPGIPWKDYKQSVQTLAWARSESVYGPYVKKKNTIYVFSDLRSGGTTSFPWAGGALNFPFIKISDIMLLKAEALVELNQNLDAARDLVNEIRLRAKNTPHVKKLDDPTQDAANYKVEPYPATGWTQDYARKAVRFERRLELCLEGQRYFDLLRYGNAEPVLLEYLRVEKTKRSYLSGATYSIRTEFYPIPQSEIDLGRGVLKQDPNY